MSHEFRNGAIAPISTYDVEIIGWNEWKTPTSEESAKKTTQPVPTEVEVFFQASLRHKHHQARGEVAKTISGQLTFRCADAPRLRPDERKAWVLKHLDGLIKD